MANIIAVIWDCDRTLIDGYMQDPIFAHYGVDPKMFWAEVNADLAALRSRNVRVNGDTYYLNRFIREAHGGVFPGLGNEALRGFGRAQKLYPGVPEIFDAVKRTVSDDPGYEEYGIKVENYVVSTGFAELIRGSEIMPHIDGVWGCELLDGPSDCGDVINEIVYTIDNTTKTRALFEINKGIGRLPGIDVNSRIPKENRRVRMENMIYVADGPSDIPAFSVVKQNGGATFAVYPRGDMEALRQVDGMRADGRVDFYAEADYSAGTTARMWLENTVRGMADRIREEEKKRIVASASAAPRHLE